MVISIKSVDKKEKVSLLIKHLISRSKSLQEFSDNIGVKHPSVIRWRDKLAAPTGNNLVGLANYLGCSVNYLSNYFESDQSLDSFLAGIRKKIKKESSELRTAKQLLKSLSPEDLLELNAYLSSFLLDSIPLPLSESSSQEDAVDLQLCLPFERQGDLMIEFSYSERLCLRELLRCCAAEQNQSLLEFLRSVSSHRFREIASLIDVSPDDDEGLLSFSREALLPLVDRLYKVIDWEQYTPILSRPLIPYRSLEDLLNDIKDCETINTF